ncbi:acyl-CoA N-acyltransferase [Chaetomium fimeti]|uniref:Acyl-CoA N-acyltransferase n=1 Tax=Chaetomium fimeti TaxID=1854472 RepID=A0AAE0H780_9PEZI|nr:acyl-CoA N-acyltransferase [Chaetomium fimeti]
MPLSLRPAGEDDSASIGRVGQAAFQDSISAALFPAHLHSKSETGDPRLDEVQWRAARNIRRMREGKPTYVVVEVSEDGGDGDAQVVGFAQWELPSQTTPSVTGSSANEQQDPFPPSLDEKMLREMFEAIDEMTTVALGPSGHSNMWYLMCLAIDPAHQRRGIGKMLLQHGLDLVAKAGKDAFLVATAEGRGLYRSFGFLDVGRPAALGTTPHYPMLWKKPNVDA